MTRLLKIYHRGVTCPPKTNPEVMLGLVHTGGRKDAIPVNGYPGPVDQFNH
jgi:hypothetical protein